MKYVLVIGEASWYYPPFRMFGRLSHDQGLFGHPDKVALVVFTGGADISPSLYGHRPSRLTTCLPKRDVFEMLAFRRARKLNLPLVGICRGAQFLCAMAGGTLFQHVSGHDWGRHTMRTWDKRVVSVTSTHHQMQNPPRDATVLGWAEPRLSDVYVGESDRRLAPPRVECECAYYPSINALGMQYHPEIMSKYSQGFALAEELTDLWLLNRPVAQAV